MKAIKKYIINEIWPVFFSGLFIFVFIALSAQILREAEWIVSFSVGPLKILLMVWYLIPSLVLFALPAVTLLAILMAFLRMSGDNEIMALKSLGVSLKQMLPPVLFVSLTAGCLAVFLSFFGAPWANNAFENLLFNIAQTKSDIGIKERVFSNQFKGITFYVQQFSGKDRIMEDIFIVDATHPQTATTYIAKQGKLTFMPESRSIHFELRDVVFFRTTTGSNRSETGKLDSYNLPFSLNNLLAGFGNREPSAKEIPINRFIHEIKKNKKGSARYNELMTELMNKFSVPLAVFLMGLIGFPLGAQIKSGGRVVGTVVSLLVFVLYYLLLAGIKGISEIGRLSPQYGAWIPLVFLFLSYLYLFKRAKNEQAIHFFERYLFAKIAR
ncbi:MAG: YjgP/YjgQ family permease [Desulfobacteraceae bacterium]|nr:MAG: YjgP/YjgQ family permease [Desulfobacteraceae bacterium]